MLIATKHIGEMMAFSTLTDLGIKSPFKEKYDNFIGGKWVKPVDGRYFENITPISDVRGSADFRTRVCQDLFDKYVEEHFSG